MKTSSFSLSAAAAALLAAALLASSTSAQAPQQSHSPEAGHAAHELPAPKNLQVLPKTLTGQQVHDIMEHWAAALGVHCDTCHVAEPGKKAPNGWPVLDFPNDSKPEKKAARLMVKMTQDINENYVSMVDEGKGKVTCGTCHRGHLKPQTYVPPPEHGHPHPGAPAHPGV